MNQRVNTPTFRPYPAAALVGYSGLLALFYYIYVPLVTSYQAVLVPLLVLTALLAALDLRRAILWFALAFPLVNILPYLCGIKSHIPHAPTALVLFLALVWGWRLRCCLTPVHLRWDHSLRRPLLLLSLVLVVSALITGFRYLNFFPFRAEGAYELIVNVNGVRTGGALMSSVFTALNYLTGFLFFFMVYTFARSRDFVKKVLLSLLCSSLIAMAFAVVQKLVSMSLGNTRFFVNIDRLNATFKDPNSFGVFLACLIPILLGLAAAWSTRLRYLFLGALILALVVFPWAGSRSGMLGLAAGLVLFAVLALVYERSLTARKKRLWGAGLLLAAALAGTALVAVSGGTNLYSRIAGNIEDLSQQSALKQILDPGRFRLWAVAWHLIELYPASGVGAGGYIIEFPNYNAVEVFDRYHTDSAENYVLQAGAEMGLPGAALALWILFELLRLILRGRRAREGEQRFRFLRVGLSAALGCLLVNLMFHSYIGAFDVKYVMWLLAGLLAGLNLGEGPGGSATRLFSRSFLAAAAVLTVLCGAGLLWHSTRSLSLPQGAVRHGWEQNFGLYQSERDEEGRSFTWTKKTAGFTFSLGTDRTVSLPIRASHPRIARYPVTVRIYRADAYFRKGEEIRELRLDHSRWEECTLAFENVTDPRVFLVFEVDRVWQPKKYLGSPDTRWLGIAIGAPL